MPEGYHDFAAGEDLTAANLESYCELQGIMRFASAAARDTALSAVKTEGMFAYLLDLNTVTVYNGSAWSTIGPVHGALTNWTPTVTQSGSVTVTVTKAVYIRTGRWIQGHCVLAVTGSGTGANNVVVSIPVTAAATGAVGSGYIIDASANISYGGISNLASTTTMVIISGGSSAGSPATLGASNFTAGLASGDAILAQFAYEAAADA